MEQDVLRELRMESRDAAVAFLKSLWAERPQPCPRCGGTLDFLHRKAKKSNDDWRCTGCGTVFRTIDLLKRLNER
jgi:uncharacterized Zn finger protein